MIRAVLDDNREVSSADFFCRRDLFKEKCSSALVVSAVFIGTGVPCGSEKLIVKVSAVSMHFNAVCACTDCELECAFELIKKYSDLFYGKCMTLDIGRVEPAGLGRRDGNSVLF